MIFMLLQMPTLQIFGTTGLTWRLKLKNFPKGTKGGRELNADLEKLWRNHAQDHLLMEIDFPSNYPRSPPFMRIVCPKYASRWPGSQQDHNNLSWHQSACRNEPRQLCTGFGISAVFVMTVHSGVQHVPALDHLKLHGRRSTGRPCPSLPCSRAHAHMGRSLSSTHTSGCHLSQEYIPHMTTRSELIKAACRQIVSRRASRLQEVRKVHVTLG